MRRLQINHSLAQWKNVQLVIYYSSKSLIQVITLHLSLHEMYVKYGYDNKVFKKMLALIYYGR